jgi:ferredoxin-NADP reductase
MERRFQPVLLTLAIREVTPATSRSRGVKIALGGRPFAYRAGQALRIADHQSERRRAYSITSPPISAARDDSVELLVGVDADGRAGAHLTLEPGTLVDVEGPIGGFVFPERVDAHRFVFIAGGTGIAPLRAMLHEAIATSDAPVALVYSARTSDDFAYSDEMQRLARDGRIELRQTVTRGRDTDGWTGRRGRIDRDMLAPFVSDPASLCFVCGPMPLVIEMQQLLDALEVPPHRVQLEEWLRRHGAAASNAARPSAVQTV